MTEPSQSEELQRLRENVAALTRRVFHLEELLRLAPADSSASEQLPGRPTVGEEISEEPVIAIKAQSTFSRLEELRLTNAQGPSPSAIPPEALRTESTPPATLEPPLPAFLRMPAKATAHDSGREASTASLESRIGGQWLNRIGIIAVLVGLSYFLKLAFENNWIGPATQVLIGLVAGVGLLFWSERFRVKGYPAFAYSLKAVAIGALYLSLWAASQYYHLVPPLVSFFGMSIVTLVYAAISLRQNAELLAAYAVAAGFLTPVLISTGENHEIALFTYLLLLDLGTAWIATLRNWQRLLWGSIASTAVLFVEWKTQYYTPPQLAVILTFVAAFFLLYTTVGAKLKSELLTGVALACGIGAVLVLGPQREQELGMIVILLLFDLATLWLTTTRTWRRLLIGSFLGTAAVLFTWSVSYYTPAALGTTLGFATIFFLLYAAAPFLGEGPPRKLHSIELVLVCLLNAATYFLACYLMLWRGYRLSLVGLTLAVAVLYFILAWRLPERERHEAPLFAPLHLALAITFVTLAIPLKFGGHWLALGWLAEAAALFWASHRSCSLLLRWMAVAALLLGGLRLVVSDSDAWQRPIVNPRFGLYLVAIGALALLARFTLSESDGGNRRWTAGAILGINMLALLALHFEIVDFFQPQFAAVYSQADRQSVETVQAFTYSAVWMIYGSCLMLVGFWKKSAFLRWQAIVLLAATVIKVFLFDIGTLERGYRIAAFIALGTILLAVSFFYQRSRAKPVG